MQGVFVEVALCPDEDMRKEAAEMFSKLKHIEVAHLFSSLVKGKQIFRYKRGITAASQPHRHERGGSKDEVGPNSAGEIVELRKGPFGEGIASLLASIHLGILSFIDVVIQEPVVEE
jgi:hypothetical protein